MLAFFACTFTYLINEEDGINEEGEVFCVYFMKNCVKGVQSMRKNKQGSSLVR